MKKLVVVAAVLLIMAGLVIPVLAQDEGLEGLDLSPVPGKFKIVFRNCLRVGVRVDVQAPGVDFWEGEVPGWVDVPVCPSQAAAVNTSPLGGDRYRGTMGTTFNGETFTLNYEFDSVPGGVVVVSFLNEHTVEVKPVDTSELPPATPTATPGPPVEEESADAAPAQPAATGAEPVATPASAPSAPASDPPASPAEVPPAAPAGDPPAAPADVPGYSHSEPGTLADVPPYVASANTAPVLPGSTPVYSAKSQPAPLTTLPVTGLGIVSIKSPWVPALVGLLLALVMRRILRLRE